MAASLFMWFLEELMGKNIEEYRFYTQVMQGLDVRIGVNNNA